MYNCLFRQLHGHGTHHFGKGPIKAIPNLEDEGMGEAKIVWNLQPSPKPPTKTQTLKMWSLKYMDTPLKNQQKCTPENMIINHNI